MKEWDRLRFKANAGDYRPIKWPPPGPYWCSGSGDNYSWIVAYFPSNVMDADVYEFWPEATEIDRMQLNIDLTFSDRFKEPDWWKTLLKKKGIRNA